MQDINNFYWIFSSKKCLICYKDYKYLTVICEYLIFKFYEILVINIKCIINYL